MKFLKNEYKTRTLNEYELSNFLRDLRKEGLEIHDVRCRYDSLVEFTRDFLIVLLKKYKIVTDEMLQVYKKSSRIANKTSGREVVICGEDFGIGDSYPNENTGGVLNFNKGVDEPVRIRQVFDFSWGTLQHDKEDSFVLPPIRNNWNITVYDIEEKEDREVLKKLLIEISKCRFIMNNYLSHLCISGNTYTFLKNHIKSPITWGKLLKFDENLFNEYLRLNRYDKNSVFVDETSSVRKKKSYCIKNLENEPRVILNKLRETLEK